MTENTTLQDATEELCLRVEDMLGDLPYHTALILEELVAKIRSHRPRECIPGHCALCGEPMPEGEEMFRYHGYSGPCPS